MRPVLCVVLLALAVGLLVVLVPPTAGSLHEEDFTLPCQTRFEVAEKTIPQLQAALQAGQVTSEDLVELYLERIAAYDQAGPRLNAIRDVNPNARQIAQQRDQDRQQGMGGGPLF